jgi:hypothetical protein
MSRQRGILEETPRDTGDELLGERSYPGEEQSSNEHNETAVPAPPPPAPRIVEGTVIESILLSSAAGEATETEDTPPPAALHPSGQLTRRTRLVRIGVFITAWMIPVVLVGLLLLAQVVPGLAGPLSRIVPISEDLHLTSAITAVTGSPDERRQEVRARLLSVSTPTVAQTVPTTGTGHMSAMHAMGTVTFYNEATYPQTIASGTVLTGADGIQIVTKTVTLIPAGNPPRFGMVTVPARAMLTGRRGNIAAFDLDGLCYAAGVAVKNTMAFTGGQRAHDYAVVAQRDVAQVAGPLTTTLTKNAQGAFGAQVHPNEQAATPSHCTPTVHPDHPVGSEVAQVIVTVSVTCRGDHQCCRRTQL